MAKKKAPKKRHKAVYNKKKRISYIKYKKIQKLKGQVVYHQHKTSELKRTIAKLKNKHR